MASEADCLEDGRSCTLGQGLTARSFFQYLKKQNTIKDMEDYNCESEEEDQNDEEGNSDSLFDSSQPSSGYLTEKDTTEESESEHDDSVRDPDFVVSPQRKDKGFVYESETSDSDYSSVHKLLPCNVAISHVSESDCSDSDASEIIPFPALCLPRLDPSSSIASTSTNITPAITVQSTEDKKGWYCMYCKKEQKKIPRHLVSMHSTEDLVTEYVSAEGAQKKNLLFKIRQLGNYLHNNEVLRAGKGTIIVSHRPSATETHENYVPCPDCYGYYKSALLYKHQCPLATTQKMKGRSKVRIGRRLKEHAVKMGRVDFDEFLQTMRSDQIGIVAEKDCLISKFGIHFFRKHGHDVDKHQIVRSNLRDLAKLLIQLRSDSGQSSASLEDFINPRSVDCVISATRALCGFSSEDYTFAKPSLAKSIGMNIKKCAVFLKSEGLSEEDDLKEIKASKFLSLLELRWNVSVSHHADRTLCKRKRASRVGLLPLSEDIVKLSTYLQTTASECVDKLEGGCKQTKELSETWKVLNSTILTQVMLFNRRRQGEISRMKVKDIETGSTKPCEGEIAKALSPLEQKLVEKLAVVEIEGKRGRTVPVLLTASMKHTIDVLLRTRELTHVNKDNVYLFPRMNFMSTGHLRGSDCLREQTDAIDLKHPELLRSTRLRKHIASMCQIVNLKEHELDAVADFLGHDIRIHRDFYRLPQRAFQTAKVSKLLIGMEQGTFTQFAGCSLEDVVVTAEDVLPLEDETEANVDQGNRSTEFPKWKGTSTQNVEDREASSSTSNPSPANIFSMSENEEWIPTPSGAFGLSGKRKKCSVQGRRHWIPQERQAIFRHFLVAIKSKHLPGKQEIEKALKEEPALRNRTWRNIKDFIRNTILKEQDYSV